MSESGRKRKSKWDCVGEPQLPTQIGEPQLPTQISTKDSWHEKGSCSDLNVGHDPKRSELEDENAKGSVIQKEDRRDLNDFPDARKAWDGDRSYHVSSTFDRLEPQNRSRSPEDSRSLSSRYRSRSRDRGRGRSRSPTRGRGRSRDRDWEDRGRGKSRSRSPLGGYRQESYRWTDRRRTGLGGLASQPCRDFAFGKCRRGSECRFLHQDNLNHKDGGRSEVERSERWRTAQERGGNDYNGEKDGPMRSSGKFTVFCNDFMNGRCYRGPSCKFSHDDDAMSYNSERSNRDYSFDHDYKRQRRSVANTPCKFFMMGICNRENCRFSHDCPVQGYSEGKSQDNTWSKDFDVMNNSLKCPKWGEANAVSDISQCTDWSNVEKETFIDEMNNPCSVPKWCEETAVPGVSLSASWGNVEVETFIDPALTEKQTDDTRAHNLEIGMSTGWVNNCEDMNLADLAYSEKRPDPPCSPHCQQSLTPMQISKDVPEQIIGQETSGRLHPTTVMHSVFPQQHQNQVGDNNKMTDGFYLLRGVDVFASAPHPDFLPVQNNNKEADSFLSVGGIDQRQQIVSVNPSSGLDIDLNGPVQQNYSPSNLKNQSQIQHEESLHNTVNAVPMNVVNNEQVGQISTFPLSLMQIIGNGQLPQLYAALNPANSIETVSSLSHSAILPAVTCTSTKPDPASISQKQCNPIPDSIECTSNDAVEHNSAVGFDSVKLHKNDFPEDNSQRNPELIQQKTVADSGYEGKHKSIAEKRKLEQENMRTGNVDARSKILDDNIEKDEKAMRLFKIALVEFVKEILKPKWKEGQMTREVHKNIVKKVVDKVTSTIQGANIPKAQDKIDQYLLHSKPKLTKLVEAYTEKFSKCP